MMLMSLQNFGTRSSTPILATLMLVKPRLLSFLSVRLARSKGNTMNISLFFSVRLLRTNTDMKKTRFIFSSSDSGFNKLHQLHKWGITPLTSPFFSMLMMALLMILMHSTGLIMVVVISLVSKVIVQSIHTFIYLLHKLSLICYYCLLHY